MSAKFGDGHFAAMLRLGLAETRNIVYPDSNIAKNSEYGLFGNKTPGEVANDRKSEPGIDLNEERSILETKMQEAIDKMQGMHRENDRSLER